MCAVSVGHAQPHGELAVNKAQSTMPEPQPPIVRRPERSKYSPELLANIQLSIKNDGLSIKRACELHGVPMANYYYWIDEYGLAESHARAKLILSHHWADKVLDLAHELADPGPGVSSATVKAKSEAARIFERMAGLLNQAEYGVKVETINRNEHLVYVVSFGGDEQPQVIDVTPEPEQLPPPTVEAKGRSKTVKSMTPTIGITDTLGATAGKRKSRRVRIGSSGRSADKRAGQLKGDS